MKQISLKYIIISLIIIILQIFLFNNINIRIGNSLFTPYAYLLIILLLPFNTPTSTVLIFSFVTGLIIDISSGTLALHTSATVFVGFLRQFILKWITPRQGYNPGTTPSYLFYGYKWFITYTFILTLIHQFIFFMLDIFSLKLIFYILYKTVLNSVFTTLTIAILHYIFKNRPAIA